jgi:hypothetical protein
VLRVLRGIKDTQARLVFKALRVIRELKVFRV